MEREILNTSYVDNYSYEEYKEYCEDNELECFSEGSEEYYDWVRNQIELEIDLFFENLQEVGLSDNKVQIFSDGDIKSYLALWNGTRVINTVTLNNFNEVYRNIINSCDDIIIHEFEDYLRIEGLHHDGTNVYNVRFLDDEDKVIKLSELIG